MTLDAIVKMLRTGDMTSDEAVRALERSFQESVGAPETKTCVACGVSYPASLGYFYRAVRNPDGFTIACRECVRAAPSEYNYHPPTAAAIQSWNDRKLAEDPEYFKRKARKAHQSRNQNPRHVLNSRMASAIRQTLRGAGGKRGSRWEEVVGYTVADLKAHLESLFRSGMTWRNMGEWHIDHIRPKASFNYTSADAPEFKACWALDNLQPLWASENHRKSAKWPT